jgi:hypothetical protein
MSSPLEQGPPGGDYVRYIERLVEQSAVLLQQHQAEPARPPAAAPAPASRSPRAPRPRIELPKGLPQGAAGAAAQRFAPLWRWRWLLAALLVALCVVWPQLLGWLVFAAVLAWQQVRGKKK